MRRIRCSHCQDFATKIALYKGAPGHEAFQPMCDRHGHRWLYDSTNGQAYDIANIDPRSQLWARVLREQDERERTAARLQVEQELRDWDRQHVKDD